MDIPSKGGSMMQQAQQIWSMLDDMSQNNPQAYRKFIDKQMQEAKDLRQPPQAHMCVHTNNLRSSKLLYINVCSWNKISSPKSKTAPIPVSGGDIYQEIIDGKQCDLITVAFNETVLKEFGIDSPLTDERNMLINLALDYIEDQYKLKLSRSYVVYPKKKPMKGTKEGMQKYFMKKYQGTDEKFESELTELEKSFGPMAEGCKDTLLAKLSNMADDEKVDVNDYGEDDKPLLDKLTNISVSLSQNENIKGSQKNLNAMPKSESDSCPPPMIQEIGEEDASQHQQTIRHGNISENNPCESCDIAEERNDAPNLQEPEYTTEIKEKDSEKSLCVKIKLEGVKSVSECELHVSQDSLELEVTDRYYLKLTLPCSVDEDEAQAQFQRKAQLLTLNIPVLQENH